VQLTFAADTAPFEVAGVNVQVTVSTTVPGGCSTVIVAEVNERSVICSVQFGLGQSGAPAIVLGGGTVSTRNATLPFLISDAGIAWLPETVIGAGF
jgi:hypothetical protein